MTRRPWKDSLGITHRIPDTLLAKGGPAAFAEPPPATEGAFRLLVDELNEFRARRRRAAAKVRSVPTNTRDEKAELEAEAVSRADHMPSIRQGRPGAVRKSFAAMADELAAMTKTVRDGTERIQRRTARALIDDLSAQAKAGRLGAIEAAKLDALRHANATALGLTATGVRR